MYILWFFGKNIKKAKEHIMFSRKKETDKKRELFPGIIDDYSTTNAVSGMDCTGSVPRGRNLTGEEYQNIGDVTGVTPSPIEPADQPVDPIDL